MKKNSRIVNIDYEKNKTPWFYFIPLLLIAGFVPLIVHGKYIDLTGTTQALYWTGQNQLLDFFSYWKSRWVIYLTATALITYIFLLITKKLPFKKEYKYYIPLAIYAFFVILSTIFAIDVPTALNGFVDMYQGMWVLLSYVLLTFLTINFVNSERDVKLFLYAFVFLIIVEGLIGVGQYFGFDIFNTKFGNSIIIPSGVNVDGGLNFNFGKHTIYGTLFNTNYVGSFATLMLPMAVVFLISARTIRQRIIAGIALVLCLFTWIGCNSRAGYVGVAVALVVSFLMLRKYVIRYWKVSVSICLAGIICAIVFNYMSGELLLDRLSSINIFKEIDLIKEKNDKNNLFKFESVEINDNIVSIKTTYQNLNIKVGEKISFLDDDGVPLNMRINENGLYMVSDINNSYLRVKIPTNFTGFLVSTPWPEYGELIFYIEGEKISMVSNTGVIFLPASAEKVDLFDGYESFASNRGYIWSRTIPIIKSTFFVGKGSDNFIYAFPHNDVVNKLNICMSPTTVIDKPHNMYLQIAVNSGAVSLISILMLCLIYVFSSIKLFWNIRFDSLDKLIGFGCFVSIVGYLFTGLFNDYVVSIAPLFWLIWGLGISINEKLKARKFVDE